MQKVAPIRRYVLLRHREHSSPVRRWSIERIAPAPRAGARAPREARATGT